VDRRGRIELFLGGSESGSAAAAAGTHGDNSTPATLGGARHPKLALSSRQSEDQDSLESILAMGFDEAQATAALAAARGDVWAAVQRLLPQGAGT
jgi:hypothetical protein